ncbi:MAG: helix-turn-helix transcriptional regulator [Colwellia sp.]|nr:helix-turn-helix transcriptional regulator [Colwellia sp.]
MTDLKKIQLKMYTPCAKLQDFVQTIWLAKNSENRQKLNFKILSDCGSGLILNFGDSICYQTKNKQLIANKECTTLGPSTDLITITFNNNIHCFGIRFFPATGHHFFNVTMEKLKGDILLTTKQHFNNSTCLYQNLTNLLAEGVSDEKIITTIENHLLELLKISQIKQQKLLTNILSAINNDNVANVSQLCNEFSISLRDLQRLFKTYIGITPNAYMRINKIRKIKTTIANNQFKSLTQLSNDYDYFDQAHFIREFKTFMEETPKKYYQLKANK